MDRNNLGGLVWLLASGALSSGAMRSEKPSAAPGRRFREGAAR